MGVLTAAQEFQKLLDYKYEFIVVKNRNSEPLKLTLTFSKSDFFHLCGFQYLDDLRHLNTNTGVVFDEIINGNSQYSDSMFESSVYYSKIEDRVQLLEKLETLLDNKDNVNRSHRILKFNRNANNNSRIEADFIIRDESDNLRNYFLIDKNNNGQYYGRSCFARTLNQRDYAAGHTAYTILYKGKVNLITNSREDLFIAPSYRTEFEAQQTTNNVVQTKFDNPLSDMQSDGTLAVSASDIFRNALTSLTGRLETFVQKIAGKIQETLTTALSKPQNADTAPSETVEQKSEPVQQKSAPEIELAPEDDDRFIIRDIYSVFVSNTGVQGYENYVMIIPESELDFRVPITYETEQIQEKQDMEQDISAGKAMPSEFRKRQTEYDDL